MFDVVPTFLNSYSYSTHTGQTALPYNGLRVGQVHLTLYVNGTSNKNAAALWQIHA